ncbi:PQQ-dependent sugar dehydrogenase [Kaarinaea lacus]
MVRNQKLTTIVVFINLALSACFNNSDVDEIISGLDTRPSNTTCLAPDSTTVQPSDITIEPAFPNLPNLDSVVALVQAPGDDTNWYAVLQHGVVARFTNDPLVSQHEVWIGISAQVSCCGEQGLLGMAFHPDYANNGEVFLSYTDVQGHSNISRFINVNNQWQETNIITVTQPAGNHNGGNIAFGPDGYLYIGLGDGGGSNDNQYTQSPDIGHGQDTKTLLGSMLRIDVDNIDVNSGSPYSIPTDNPYYGNALCSDHNTRYHNNDCPEIYAWGLRNPWRWSFDSQTGELWAGDVGQNHREEVDIIELGGNYGWKITEGLACRGEVPGCDKTGLIDPIIDYSHTPHCSITGGFVYRGNDPALLTAIGNSYLYSDYCSTRLWGLRYVNQNYQNQELTNLSINRVQSFAQANNGDLFVLRDDGGAVGSGENIYKIVANPSAPPPEVASLLSESGCVDPQDPTQPAAGLIPYDIISPLWSDGAEKQRFLALPNGTTIDVDSHGDFLFPYGTVLMKNFYINNTIVETRLLMRHLAGWAGYSYEWQYDQDNNPVDAQLLTTSLTKSIEGQNWYYPSQGECLQCHTQSSNTALGPEVQQLNKTIHYPSTGRSANQMDTLQHIGLFTTSLNPEIKNLKLYALTDNAASLEQRAKSYLHSNCAHCHQPGEIDNTATMDLRYHIALVDMNVCDVIPQRDDLGLTAPKIIDPNGTYDAINSVLVLRMEEDSQSGLRMPQLASEVVDTQAVEILKQWIVNLTGCP